MNLGTYDITIKEQRIACPKVNIQRLNFFKELHGLKHVTKKLICLQSGCILTVRIGGIIMLQEKSKTEQSIFIQNVKTYMTDLGYTQESLAGAVGVSRSYINLLLSESRVMTPKMMAKIADILNISVNKLLTNNKLQTEDYDICLRGNLSNRGSKLAFNRILVDMDNYVLLSNKEEMSS